MKAKQFVIAVFWSLGIVQVASADTLLDRSQIVQIFQQLTNRPRKTWIPAGTIEAMHREYRAPVTTDQTEIVSQINQAIQEYQRNTNKRELTEDLQKMKFDAIPFNVRYRLSNEYTMASTVTVRFDGDRFYWEINVSSRDDSVKPGEDLAGNYMTDRFDLAGNARRIFAWDGQEYTLYSLPGNCAIVDARSSTQHSVNGPLTAGFTPWGYGYYTYENLCAVYSSAVQKYVDGREQIHLTLGNPDGSELAFVLDPQKAYAVLSCSMTKPGSLTTVKEYSGHRLVAGSWIPTTILIEQYDAASNRVMASDFWEFTVISGDPPGPASFDVRYEPGALIEYRSPVSDEPLMYRCSGLVDTDALLAERLTIAASEGTQAQNCATAAMKYVASQLGKDVTDQQLARLVSEPDKITSLYAMKEFAKSLGFYCRAVKTDVQTLRTLYGCKAVLHIPGRNHFVVLGGFDNEYVWTIDLANNKFFYRTDTNFFDMDWTEGTALLVSNQRIQIQGNFTEIDDSQLRNMVGALGYTCTRLLQTYNVIFCTYIGGFCEGYYQEYFTRYGCQAAQSGSCSSSMMLRYRESPCIEDPYDPWNCTITWEWKFYYMRACA